MEGLGFAATACACHDDALPELNAACMHMERLHPKRECDGVGQSGTGHYMQRQ